MSRIPRILHPLESVLDHIQSPEYLRRLKPGELESLCAELRAFLIDKVLVNGGHFSANLGTVELTVALHYVLNTPEDQLVWDVGHQAYPHKILTGRKDSFETIRKKGGLSGFPSRFESLYDIFGTGHSSTSISAVLGMAVADKLSGKTRRHVAVIGDGSLTAGMAWEALNNAAVSNTNILIIINDNNMGIDPNSGALDAYLKKLDQSKPNFFEDLGFHYEGPDNGHDVSALCAKLSKLIRMEGPKIWHVKTVKGKGYAPAEQEQTKWHAVKYVKITEGAVEEGGGDKFQEVFGYTLLDLAKSNEKIVGVTPAMPSGCSMNILMREIPNRTFDVGIAEQHAVTFSAGLAVNGFIPFCNLYSTFAQRAFDQIMHDVCLQSLPVIFCLDRAGAVGEDGATHQGLFDIPFLRSCPNLVIACPADEIELRQMMYTASLHTTGPFAIRYPKGKGSALNWRLPFNTLPIGRSEWMKPGNNIVVLALGTMLLPALEAAGRFEDVAVVNMRFVQPIDQVMLKEVGSRFKHVITVEDGCLSGGFGSAVLEYFSDMGLTVHVHRLGFDPGVVEHASREEQLEMANLSPDGIAAAIQKTLESQV